MCSQLMSGRSRVGWRADIGCRVGRAASGDREQLQRARVVVRYLRVDRVSDGKCARVRSLVSVLPIRVECVGCRVVSVDWLMVGR